MESEPFIEEVTRKEKKQPLSLTPVLGKEGLFEGYRSNGTKYTVRADRNRYFKPKEWLLFLQALRKDKRMLYETLLQSGGRIEEVLNIKPSDFTWDSKTLRLRVTKTRAKKGERKILGGKQRSFAVSSQFIRKIRGYIKEKNISDDEKIFTIRKQSASETFKAALKRAGLKEWEFSLHNIRKTSGMWLKTVQRRTRDLDVSEICMRLGHDHETFLKHYGSPSIFTDQDRDLIIEILGDVYGLR